MTDRAGRTGVIVAARTDSSRLPGKALLPLAGVPSILFLLRRLQGMKHAAAVILATTDRAVDNRLADMVSMEGVPVFRGACNDVAGRYVDAAAAFGFDRVVRVTGDCPLLDGATIDECLDRAGGLEDCDLATTKGSYPVGIDCEIYLADRLAALHRQGRLSPEECEHVTLHFYRPGSFRIRRLQCPPEWISPERALTLDTPADYDALSRLINRAGRPDTPVPDLLAILDAGGTTA
ncbi:cytidylyltransferase domain-containing protein [Azospirillum argentinense]